MSHMAKTNIEQTGAGKTA